MVVGGCLRRVHAVPSRRHAACPCGTTGR